MEKPLKSNITLTREEFEKLEIIAKKNMRSPPGQIRYWISKEEDA